MPEIPLRPVYPLAVLRRSLYPLTLEMSEYRSRRSSSSAS